MSCGGGRGQALPSKIHYSIIPEHGSYTCSSAWKSSCRHAYGLVEHRLLACRGGQVESDGSYHRQSQGGGRYLDRVSNRDPSSLPQAIHIQVSTTTLRGYKGIHRTAPTLY